MKQFLRRKNLVPNIFLFCLSVSFLSITEFLITHSKNSFSCNFQALSHLKHIAQVLENRTPRHSTLHQILKNHKINLSKNELSWLVDSRNTNSHWLGVAQREAESGTCLRSMVGP
jgi:hypothetical protein